VEAASLECAWLATVFHRTEIPGGFEEHAVRIARESGLSPASPNWHLMSWSEREKIEEN
jgi:hypothetical protein